MAPRGPLRYQRGVTTKVRFDLRGDVAVITMDDGKANALAHDMIDQLDAAIDRAEDGAKAIVLTGREERFCAGFDLRVMMQGPAAATALVTAGGALLLRLYELGLPLVVACTGHALAGGVLLAATGDTRIGVTGAFKLGLNEVANGLPVPILAHAFARDRLARRELVAATVQARIYDPRGAVAAGWLDRIVEPGQLMDEALAEATALARLPAAAYRLTKRSLRSQTVAHIRATMADDLAALTGGG